MHLLNANSESPHAVEDLVGGPHPPERCAAVVVGVDVREDSGAQLRNARVRSTLERFLRQQPKEPLDQIEPRGVGGREMKLDAGMAQQPSLDRWRAVSGEIVEDDVDVERGLDGRFDLAQKGDEILRPMLGLASGDHLAGRDVERGEQIQSPMAHVVVSPSLGLAEVHRQDRLRALQRLDLRLLVHREDHGIRRRSHVQAHHVPDLLHELRIRRELETLRTMRLQPECPPDASDHRMTDARRLRHGPGAPVRLAAAVSSPASSR